MADDQRSESFDDATVENSADAIVENSAELSEESTVESAEQVAAKARSARPVKKARTSQPESSVDEDAATSSAASATAATAASRRPVKRTPAAAGDAEQGSRRPVRRPVDKSELNLATPTRKQAEAAVVAHRRTTPVQFVNQSVGELRKVLWPTADQLRQYFIVVLVFVLFIIAYVSLLDYGFGWILLKLLGK